MPPDALELRRWLAKARNDQRAAEALAEQRPPITDVAAFHCQQAVEKLLKAYLYSRGVDFERTHDLRALALLCADHDSTFDSILNEVAALTPFAVRFRYPGPADPSEQQVHEALLVVARVLRFVYD